MYSTLRVLPKTPKNIERACREVNCAVSESIRRGNIVLVRMAAWGCRFQSWEDLRQTQRYGKFTAYVCETSGETNEYDYFQVLPLELYVMYSIPFKKECH